jgi:hypothetical protein
MRAPAELGKESQPHNRFSFFQPRNRAETDIVAAGNVADWLAVTVAPADLVRRRTQREFGFTEA